MKDINLYKAVFKTACSKSSIKRLLFSEQFWNVHLNIVFSVDLVFKEELN